MAFPFPGFNVGCVSEGGVTEQEAGLQVSLQLHCKSSKWAHEWLPKPFAKEHKINHIKLHQIKSFYPKM